MANHPNRKQFPLRLSAAERDALVALVVDALARVVAAGRNSTLLQSILRKLRDPGA